MENVLTKETGRVYGKVNGITIINFIFTCLLFTWMATPYLFRNIESFTLILIFTGWLLSFIILSLSSKLPQHLIFPVVWFIFILIYKFLGISTSTWGNYYTQFFYWLCIYIGFFSLKTYPKKIQKYFLAFIWIIVTINIIDNIRLNILYPQASSQIYQSWGSMYLEMNVGDTGFSLFALYYFVFNLALLRHVKKIKPFAIFGIIISIAYILLSARATTFLLLVFLLFSWVITLLIGKRTNNWFLHFAIIFALFSLAFVILYPLAVRLITNIAPDNSITHRLQEIVNMFFGGNYDTVSSGEIRIDDSFISISTWLSSVKNFFFGVGFHGTDATTSTILQYGIGQHSNSIDNLARYGIIGTTLYFLALIMPMIYFYRKFVNKRFYLWVYLSLIIFSFMNSFNGCSYLGIFLYVTFPLLENLINKKGAK